jgi:thiol peroxidase
MAQILLQGNPLNTVGDLPSVGSDAPEFTLTGTDLADVQLKDYAGKKVVLNIFTSVDTSVCALSVKRFNAEAAKRPGTVVLNVSRDLPFALARFCGAEGIENAVSVSALRDLSFGRDYGVAFAEGPVESLFARAVVVINENGKIRYAQLAAEHTEEPDYAAALAALDALEGVEMDTCTTSATAEHSRPDAFDEPCDDGRAG